MIGSYARISDEEQSQYSINDQLFENKKKAQSLFPKELIKEYIDEGETGKYLDRPGLSKLRKDVKEGLIKTVVIFDPDRFSRNLMNQLIVTEEIEKRGAQLIFVNHNYEKTPEGRLFYQMRGAFSEYERAKISDRMSRGRKQKARQGKVVRDYQVYGYGYDTETSSMHIIEEEAAVVRLIFDLFTSVDSKIRGINGIAKHLTEKGIPTKKDVGVWHRQVVRQILLNPVYKGEFYQNKWDTEGIQGNKYLPEDEKVSMKLRPKEEWIKVPCPAIVDEMKFNFAQKLLEESRRRWAKQSKNQYLLSGLLRCGVCGNTFTGRKSTNWGKIVFQYTDYKNTAGFKNKGCRLHIDCEKIDAFVWNAVSSWLHNPEKIIEAKEDEAESYETNEIQHIEKELERIKAGRKRLLGLFAKGIKDIGEDEIRNALTDLTNEEKTLQARLADAEEKNAETKEVKFSVQLLKEAADFYLSEGELTFDRKRDIIKHIVREVRVLSKDEAVIYTF